MVAQQHESRTSRAPVHSRLAYLIVVSELVLLGEVLILIGIASTQPSAASTWTGVGPNAQSSTHEDKLRPVEARSDHLDDGELARLAAYLGFDVDPTELDHDENGTGPNS